MLKQTLYIDWQRTINKACKCNYFIGAPVNDLVVTVPLEVIKSLPCHCAMRFPFVFRSSCSFSHTFFFGFSTSSGLPPSYSSTKTLSPGAEPSGGISVSTALGSSLKPSNYPWKVTWQLYLHWSTKNHALRLHTSHFCRLEVAQHDNHAILHLFDRYKVH